MLNQEMDSVLLVKGWKKGANWSFPRGKINKGESDLDCAIREVYEETGFDIKEAGLASNRTGEQKSIEISMREQHMRLYVFRGVPMDFEFAPRTRKEISKIQWYKLSELPTLKRIKAQQDPQTEDLAKNANKYYMVAPFLGHLKKWIGQQKKAEKDNRIPMSSAHEMPTKMAVNATDKVSAVPEEAQTSGVGDMEHLLASLRQSEQAGKAPQGNPFSQGVASMKAVAEPEQPSMSTDVSDEIPSKTSTFPKVWSESSERHIQQEAKSSDLLALLRGTPTSTRELPPETPADQLLHNPLAPPSAKLEHKQAHHPHMPPTNPRPHAFPVFPPQDGQIAPPQRPGVHTAPSLPHIHQVHHAGVNLPQRRQGLANQRPRDADYLSYIRRARPDPPASVLRNPKGDLSQQKHNGSLLGSNTFSTGPPPSGIPLATPLSTKAPYQRTGDPDFARPSQDKAEARRIIPPASNLPTPKLNNHTSSLLSLFKSPPPTQEFPSAPSITSIQNRHVEAPATKGSTSRLGSSDERLHPERNTLRGRQLGDQSGVEGIMSKTKHSIRQKQQQTANAIPQSSEPIHSLSNKSINPQLGAVPSQLEQIILASQNKTHQEAPDSKHQNALLDLFRKPSAAETQPRTPPKEAVPRSLELPANSFELSATPCTPGHTGGRVNPPLKSEQANAIGTSPLRKTKAHNHHSQGSHKPHKVAKGSSAAVNGPPTIPQFELMHHAKEAQDGSSLTDRHNKQPLPQGSIKILQRPSSKGVDGTFLDSTAQLPANDPDVTPKPLADPTKSAAKKPNVSPSTSKTPQASFQPQILRRPVPHAADGDLVAPSPLSPLPSPKHPVLLTRHGNEKSTHQHKQSLLAMFSQPSATSNKDDTHTSESPRPMASMDLNPLTSKQRHGSGLTDTMNSQNVARLESKASGSTQEVRTSSVTEGHAMIAGGSSSGASTQATPRGSVTALDKSFLLGYLGDVARSAR